MKICIDAGHGGKDPGAIGQANTKEKDVVLSIALKVGKILKNNGIETIYTRTTDKYVELSDRVKKSNDAFCDLFLSIHANGVNDKSAHGQETYCYTKGGTGEKLAINIQNEIVKATGLTNRGVKYSTNLYTLKHTKAPAALVETAFLTNPEEEKLLKNASWQEKIAKAIAKGVLTTLGIKEKNETLFPTSWEWAKNLGICDGNNPKNNITREQVIEILYRYTAKIK